MRQHWIDGEWSPTDGPVRARTIENPATLEAVAEVTEGTAEDARRAVAVAARAQREWRQLPAIERGHLLHEAARHLREDRKELARLLTLEGGKVVPFSRITLERISGFPLLCRAEVATNLVPRSAGTLPVTHVRVTYNRKVKDLPNTLRRDA